MNILISGGSRGIGRATAMELASVETDMIIVTGRDETALKSLSEGAVNNNIKYFVLDLTERERGLVAFINHLKDENLNIDLLINTAGLLHRSLFTESPESEAREMFEVNVFGTMFLIKEILPFMGSGSHIVNIGSMGGFQGSVKFPGLSWYSASKAAVASMTECLAAELSSSGVSVNCLCPGAVGTEMLEKAFPGYKAPLTAEEMAIFVSDFGKNGHRYFNGKILPVSVSTP
jgi:short-subunit dehydrogenase